MRRYTMVILQKYKKLRGKDFVPPEKAICSRKILGQLSFFLIFAGVEFRWFFRLLAEDFIENRSRI